MKPAAKSATRPRVKRATGWAFAGSQRHIQAYVNSGGLTAALDAAIKKALPAVDGTDLEWRAPLAKHRYAEPRDSTFWPAIERPDLASVARSCWPSGGPSWDAIAIARRPNGIDTVILVEAKANVPEFGGAPCTATSERSIKKITAAMAAVHEAIGASGAPAAWLGPYYQLANRLTWTHWLRSRGVDAVFLHLLVHSDRSHIPTSQEALLKAATSAHRALGIPGAALNDWATTVALPASG
jgi:hypothetical protein